MKKINFISVIICVMICLAIAGCCNSYSPEAIKKNNANRAKDLGKLEKRVLNLKPGSTISDTQKAFGLKGFNPYTIQIAGTEYLFMTFPIGQKFHRDRIGYWYYGIFKNDRLYSILDKTPWERETKKYEQGYLITQRMPFDPNIVISTKGLFGQELVDSLRKNFPKEKYVSNLEGMPPIPVIILCGLVDSIIPKPANSETNVPPKDCNGK